MAEILRHHTPEITYSPLVLKAIEKLKSLPLNTVKEAGIWRDRSSYFLNIAYPSMQAMGIVNSQTVYPDTAKSDGKKVALYVHMPFCTAECYYCHYYKKFGQSQDRVDLYLESISRELSMYEQKFGKIQARSVYIGGGTPSYLTTEQIDRLFSTIRRHVEILKGTETSFEVHPESGSDEKLAVLKSHGVNRINIGVESFEDRILASENRRHTAKEAINVFERAQQAGFTNVNLDLIYGLKGQTLHGWEYNLDMIAKLAPTSTTLYYLRMKHGTPEYNLWKKNPQAFPSDQDLLTMHAMSFERMEEELGYTQNPVDWFIKDPSYFHTYQDHNWRRSDETELLGIGASAYSYVDGWQYYNVNDSDRYQKNVADSRLPIWKGEKLEGEEKMRRTVMLGIKMGMDRPAFKTTFGQDVVNSFPSIWEHLENLGLVEVDTQEVRLTYSGKLFADEVGQQFYSEQMKKRMAAVDPHLVSTTWPQFNP